jgi:hypothetical protein
VQYPGNTMAAACVWIGKHLIYLGLPLPCEPLHCPYESKSRVCDFFGIWLHFLSEWTKHLAFLLKRTANLMCYLLGVSSSVRSREFSRKQPACAFRLQLSFWHGLVVLRQPEAK